jgi:hypothetical protein
LVLECGLGGEHPRLGVGQVGAGLFEIRALLRDLRLEDRRVELGDDLPLADVRIEVGVEGCDGA